MPVGSWATLQKDHEKASLWVKPGAFFLNGCKGSGRRVRVFVLASVWLCKCSSNDERESNCSLDVHLCIFRLVCVHPSHVYSPYLDAVATRFDPKLWSALVTLLASLGSCRNEETSE
jgi:hypothetical protein